MLAARICFAYVCGFDPPGRSPGIKCLPWSVSRGGAKRRRMPRERQVGVMLDLLKKYRWYLIVSILVYAAVSLWLFFATDTPQAVPFEYQVF